MGYGASYNLKSLQISVTNAPKPSYVNLTFTLYSTLQVHEVHPFHIKTPLNPLKENRVLPQSYQASENQ